MEARRASARREGGSKGGARRNGARRVGGAEGWGPDLEKVRAPRVGVRRVGARRVGHRSVGARRVGARRRGAQNFAFFFSLSRSHFRSFSLSLGVFSWKFGGVFEAPGPLNVHVWSSRAVVRKWGREREKKARNFGRRGVRRRGFRRRGCPVEEMKKKSKHLKNN